MMMTKKISAVSIVSLLCLGALGLTACDVPDEGPEVADEEELDEAEDNLCIIPIGVPGYDSTSEWDYDDDWNSFVIGGYGNGACDYWVKDLTGLQPGSSMAEFATVGSWQTITTQADCEATELWLKYWYQTGGIAWSAASSTTRTGEWMYEPFTGTYYCGLGANIAIDYPASPVKTRLRIAARIRNTSTGVNKVVEISGAAHPN
jgi:hypothetical protein